MWRKIRISHIQIRLFCLVGRKGNFCSINKIRTNFKYLYPTYSIRQQRNQLRGGSRIPHRRGANPLGGTNIRFCQIFQKLHEIEKFFSGGGAHRRPLKSATELCSYYFLFFIFDCDHLIFNYFKKNTVRFPVLKEQRPLFFTALL